MIELFPLSQKLSLSVCLSLLSLSISSPAVTVCALCAVREYALDGTYFLLEGALTFLPLLLNFFLS
jgi:hypothetical protein